MPVDENKDREMKREEKKKEMDENDRRYAEEMGVKPGSRSWLFWRYGCDTSNRAQQTYDSDGQD